MNERLKRPKSASPVVIVVVAAAAAAVVISECNGYRDEGAVEATKVVVGGVAEEGRAENGDCRESTAQERS